MAIPVDTTLYSRVKKQIYARYPKHSAYRSGILVQAYKNAFGRKYGSGKSPYKGQKPKLTGLSRWFKEKWRSDNGRVGYSSKDSVYRPTKRITSKTPTTFSELSKKRIRAAKREKAKTGRVQKFAKYTLTKNPDKIKKFKVTLPDGRSVKFGARGYSDYTIHGDEERMKRYLTRHRSREDWTKGGIDTAGFWSRWLLWSKPSLEGAKKLMERKFDITFSS